MEWRGSVAWFSGVVTEYPNLSHHTITPTYHTTLRRSPKMELLRQPAETKVPAESMVMRLIATRVVHIVLTFYCAWQACIKVRTL